MYTKTCLRRRTNSKKRLKQSFFNFYIRRLSYVEIEKNFEQLKYRVYSLIIIIFIIERNQTDFDMLGKKESIFVCLKFSIYIPAKKFLILLIIYIILVCSKESSFRILNRCCNRLCLSTLPLLYFFKIFNLSEIDSALRFITLKPAIMKSLDETIVDIFPNELYSTISKTLFALVYQLTFNNTKYNIT